MRRRGCYPLYLPSASQLTLGQHSSLSHLCDLVIARVLENGIIQHAPLEMRFFFSQHDFLESRLNCVYCVRQHSVFLRWTHVIWCKVSRGCEPSPCFKGHCGAADPVRTAGSSRSPGSRCLCQYLTRVTSASSSMMNITRLSLQIMLRGCN